MDRFREGVRGNAQTGLEKSREGGKEGVLVRNAGFLLSRVGPLSVGLRGWAEGPLQGKA